MTDTAAPPDDTLAPTLTLAQFAEISAAIAEGDRPLLGVLEAHGLSEDQWKREDALWNRRIVTEAIETEDSTLPDAFSAAFAAAQDRLKAIPEMTPEEWAALAVAHAATGQEALAARGLSSADHLRLSRHWARALASDRALAKRYFAAFYAQSAR